MEKQAAGASKTLTLRSFHTRRRTLDHRLGGGKSLLAGRGYAKARRAFADPLRLPAPKRHWHQEKTRRDNLMVTLEDVDIAIVVALAIEARPIGERLAESVRLRAGDRRVTVGRLGSR